MTEDVQNHGGLNYDELQRLNINEQNIIDFSVNSNPYGPFPKVKQALTKLDITRYPDQKSTGLRQLLSDANSILPEQIMIGNGTAEIIWLATRSLLAGKKVLIFGPTFGEYRRASDAAGAEVKVKMAKGPYFSWCVDEICHEIDQYQPHGIFLCNPNNPTGAYLSPSEIKYIANTIGDRLLIIDEAYRTFLWGNPFGDLVGKNVLVLRSMTKDFALAGIRLGYAIGEESLIRCLVEYQPSWSVNRAAQIAGEAALSDLSYLHQTISQIQIDSRHLQNELIHQNYSINESKLNYFLIHVEPETGNTFRKKMMRLGIHVRDCASFGLPDYIRIGTQLPHENLQFLKTLKMMKSIESG